MPALRLLTVAVTLCGGVLLAACGFPAKPTPAPSGTASKPTEPPAEKEGRAATPAERAQTKASLDVFLGDGTFTKINEPSSQQKIVWAGERFASAKWQKSALLIATYYLWDLPGLGNTTPEQDRKPILVMDGKSGKMIGTFTIAGGLSK